MVCSVKQIGRNPILTLVPKRSAPVNLQDLGVIHAKLPTTVEDKLDLARVEVALGGPTIWITIKHETGPWPFRIENASDYRVQFFQKASLLHFILDSNSHLLFSVIGCPIVSEIQARPSFSNSVCLGLSGRPSERARPSHGRWG